MYHHLNVPPNLRNGRRLQHASLRKRMAVEDNPERIQPARRPTRASSPTPSLLLNPPERGGAKERAC